MLQWYHVLLLILIFISLVFAAFYSFRYRRQQDPALRGLYAARMNISMGLLLIGVAIIQVALFKMNGTRLIVGTLFGLLGLFNLFAGLKNAAYFQSKQNG